MQGIDIRLKEVAVREAIIAALVRTGLQPTEGTKINFLSGPGEPVVVEVTELKAGAPPPAAPVRTEPAPRAEAQEPAAASATASRLLKPNPHHVKPSPRPKVSNVEEALFGGQTAWPEAQPYLPDDNGKIAMPDAGKHVEGRLDDDEIVVFDAKRFTVEPVPEGEAPSIRSTTPRAYEVPEEQDDVPEAYRALPSPVEDE